MNLYLIGPIFFIIYLFIGIPAMIIYAAIDPNRATSYTFGIFIWPYMLLSKVPFNLFNIIDKLDSWILLGGIFIRGLFITED